MQTKHADLVKYDALTSNRTYSIVFLFALIGCGLYTYHQPWAHTRHYDSQIPVPPRYTLINQGSDSHFDILVEERFGKGVVVQEIASPETYHKLFPEDQEHIAFMGGRYVGLMTNYKSTVWIFRLPSVTGISTSTCSVAGDKLLVHTIVKPPVAVFVIMSVFFSLILTCVYLAFVVFWRIEILPLYRRRWLQQN